MNSRRKFLCMDCKVDTGKIGEFYYVYPSIWLSVVDSPLGMLCIGCLESRLGRKLKKIDFTKSYINAPYFGNKSSRLISRLEE